MALPQWLGAISAFFHRVPPGGLWSGARVPPKSFFFEKRVLDFPFASNFSDLESRCFDLLELGGQRYTLDFESYPVLAEHVSQSVADLPYGTFRPDRSQNVINQVSISRSRTLKS